MSRVPAHPGGERDAEAVSRGRRQYRRADDRGLRARCGSAPRARLKRDAAAMVVVCPQEEGEQKKPLEKARLLAQRTLFAAAAAYGRTHRWACTTRSSTKRARKWTSSIAWGRRRWVRTTCRRARAHALQNSRNAASNDQAPCSPAIPPRSSLTATRVRARRSPCWAPPRAKTADSCRACSKWVPRRAAAACSHTGSRSGAVRGAAAARLVREVARGGVVPAGVQQ